MPSIHQMVAGFKKGDAISNEALVLQQLFRDWGFRSEIYCERKQTLPEIRSKARDLSLLAGDVGPDDLVLLHLSIGSVANDLLPALRCRKAILYHNITPPAFFRGLNEETRYNLDWGLQQTRALAGKVDLAMAVSAFNAQELEAAGHRDVKVLPLFLHRENWGVEPDRKVLSMYRDSKLNVLFVGRCAPNKRIEDLLASFYYLQNYHEPESRLLLVGSAGLERYDALLHAKALELKLRDVHFTGSVSLAHLNAYYRSAHVFLCMSEHEGFCIPLLEAMQHQVPVLAYRAAAIPETLDGAGVLFDHKDFALVAGLIRRLGRDTQVRAPIVKRQTERLARYTQLDLAARLKSYLEPLIRVGAA